MYETARSLVLAATTAAYLLGFIGFRCTKMTSPACCDEYDAVVICSAAVTAAAVGVTAHTYTLASRWFYCVSSAVLTCCAVWGWLSYAYVLGPSVLSEERGRLFLLMMAGTALLATFHALCFFYIAVCTCHVKCCW